MHKRNELANFDVWQIVIDGAVIFACYCLAVILYYLYSSMDLMMTHLWMFFVYGAVFVLCMIFLRMYNITTFYYLNRLIIRTVTSAVFASLCVSTVVFLSQIKYTSRLLFVIFCGTSCCTVIIERYLVIRYKNVHQSKKAAHALFIGFSEPLKKYSQFIDKTSMNIKVSKQIGYDDEALSSSEAFLQLLIDLSIDEVHYHLSWKEKPILSEETMVDLCDSIGVSVRIVMDVYKPEISKYYLSSIGTFPVITYHSVSFNRMQLFIKSMIDLIGAFVGLIVLSPVFLVTALAIKLESPGPILFKQKRVGVNGKQFTMYKFRSMYIDAEARKQELMASNKIKSGLMFKIDADPRITKVGAFIRKTSIDELPQLINVLKRDMSLVGTRPPTVDEVKRYCPEHRRRISIKPGITGMWQTNGRSTVLDFEEVVKLDKLYIDQWSLALDIKILLKTVQVVLSRRGAY